MSIPADSYPGQIGGFGEGAIPIVLEKKIRHVVVGDEDVLPAVIVVIEGDDTQAVAGLRSHTGRFADVCEGAVAVVVVERGCLPVVHVGVAIAAHPRALVAAVVIGFRRPVDVIGDHKVQTSVVVVVEPGRAGGPPPFVLHSCLFTDVGKCAVPIVVVKNATVVTQDHQVGKSVIVVVTDRHPHPEKPLGTHAPAFGDVGKRAISVVAVEGRPQRLPRFVSLCRRAVHHVKIEESVLVVVDPAASSAHGFDQVFLRGRCIVVPELNPCGARNIHESHLTGLGGKRKAKGAGRKADKRQPSQHGQPLSCLSSRDLVHQSP